MVAYNKLSGRDSYLNALPMARPALPLAWLWMMHRFLLHNNNFVCSTRFLWNDGEADAVCEQWTGGVSCFQLQNMKPD